MSRRKNILIVEDSPLNKLAMESYLQEFHNTYFADSVESAQKVLKNKSIDVLITDIFIKGKLNGIDLIKELRNEANFKDLPVIAISGYSADPDKKEAMNAGCDYYLPKPFDFKELLQIINKCLEVKDEQR